MMGFQKCRRINLLVMLTFLIHKCWVSRATSVPCPVSPLTVEVVEDCPDTEEKWREAAARKNCTAYASQCDEPDKLVYHCVINAFVNQTLEVCAYWRIIVLGSCAEYNEGENIQQSFRGNCSHFTKKPCPSGYPSTDAYKYPGCYELTKETAAKREATSTILSTNATTMNNEKHSSDVSPKDILIPVFIAVVSALFLAVLGMIIRWRKKKCPFFRKNDNGTRNEEKSMT